MIGGDSVNPDSTKNVTTRSLNEREKANLNFFSEINQIEILNNAANRLIGLITAVLGATITILALGKDFPPIFMVSHPILRYISVTIIFLYISSLVFASISNFPQQYKGNRKNLTQMESVLIQSAKFKIKFTRLAQIAFVLGSLLLAIFLIIALTSF